ncbi:MAG TPA: TonB-dependent receptor, partial [Chitinophagales bacterium]|nr:TonB-dependent receptor [Chitinophagales bacterium]
IVVRGNSPKGVLWRVEGIEVPSPNHFSQEGFGGGAVCLISGQAIGTSDFYAGAFPAEFGNAQSAVFDIKLRKGDSQRRHYYLQAGMMGFEGGTEGPFADGRQASYFINYRYSTLKVFEKIGFDIGNTVTSYQDLNFKLQFPSKNAGTFSVFGIGGMSEIRISEQKRHKLKDKTKTYDMAMMGISHGYSLNEKNHITSIVAVAANRESLDKDEIYAGNVLIPSYRLGASNIYLRSTVELNSRFSSKSSLRSGIIASGIRFKVDDLYDAYLKTGEVKTAEFSYVLQAHSQWKYRLSEKWTWLSGMHFLFFGYNYHYSLEPRTGLRWQITEKQSLYLSAGLHSRLESLSTYSVQDPWSLEQPNRYLDLTRSVQLVLGYEIRPAEHLTLKAETYFQYLYNVPVSTDESSYFSMLNFQDRYVTMKLVNNGRGKNYGIELTLEKSFANNYYVLANGSLFNSTFYAADGIWRNSRYNSNFITSLTAGKDVPFGKMKTWTLGANARILWSGGERTERTGFEEQIGNYFRLDTRVSIARKRECVKWLLALDIQNATNRKNENTLEEIEPTGILPVLSFRVEM